MKEENLDEKVPVRAYTKADLAMLYNPGVCITTALQLLRRWIYANRQLMSELKEAGDEYHVRGYDGGAPQDRLLTVEGFNSKYIYVSLLFPKLKKGVEVIDILELPHEKDKLPSNDDGIAKSYYDVKVKDYLSFSNKRGKKIYY